MGDIFKFQQNDDCCEEKCMKCSLVQGYMDAIIKAESPEEVESLLHGLYEDAFMQGYDECLINDIQVKQRLLFGDLDD